MERVWMVSTGWYSSFGYVAAFSKREAAEAFANSLPRADRAEVHEFDVDAEIQPPFTYFVEITPGGDVLSYEKTARRKRNSVVHHKRDGNYHCWISAENETAAAKIAMEEVMQRRAMGE